MRSESDGYEHSASYAGGRALHRSDADRRGRVGRDPRIAPIPRPTGTARPPAVHRLVRTEPEHDRGVHRHAGDRPGLGFWLGLLACDRHRARFRWPWHLSTLGPRTGTGQLPLSRLPFGRGVVLPGIVQWLSSIVSSSANGTPVVIRCGNGIVLANDCKVINVEVCGHNCDPLQWRGSWRVPAFSSLCPRETFPLSARRRGCAADMLRYHLLCPPTSPCLCSRKRAWWLRSESLPMGLTKALPSTGLDSSPASQERESSIIAFMDATVHQRARGHSGLVQGRRCGAGIGSPPLTLSRSFIVSHYQARTRAVFIAPHCSTWDSLALADGRFIGTRLEHGGLSRVLTVRLAAVTARSAWFERAGDATSWLLPARRPKGKPARPATGSTTRVRREFSACGRADAACPCALERGAMGGSPTRAVPLTRPHQSPRRLRQFAGA